MCTRATFPRHGYRPRRLCRPIVRHVRRGDRKCLQRGRNRGRARKCDLVTQTHLDDAFDRVTMGLDIAESKRPLQTRTVIAVHEAGHAIVAHCLNEYDDEVRKITIQPRAIAGKDTACLRTPDRSLLCPNCTSKPSWRCFWRARGRGRSPRRIRRNRSQLGLVARKTQLSAWSSTFTTEPSSAKDRSRRNRTAAQSAMTRARGVRASIGIRCGGG